LRPCLGPSQFRPAQKAACIVIDQSVQPEPLRCTLVKKLLQLIATLLVIFQQFKDCHWAKVVKDGLTDVPVERVSVDYHASNRSAVAADQDNHASSRH
jgi:hypothetical protein